MQVLLHTLECLVVCTLLRSTKNGRMHATAQRQCLCAVNLTSYTKIETMDRHIQELRILMQIKPKEKGLPYDEMAQSVCTFIHPL